MELTGRAEGVVTEVKTVWQIKVNLKPVRAHSLDGAVFPHRVTVSYSADGAEYAVRVYIPWRIAPPKKGASVVVLYNESKPRQCMLELF